MIMGNDSDISFAAVDLDLISVFIKILGNACFSILLPGDFNRMAIRNIIAGAGIVADIKPHVSRIIIQNITDVLQNDILECQLLRLRRQRAAFRSSRNRRFRSLYCIQGGNPYARTECRCLSHS